jgi:hypothetical protein
MSYSNQRIEFVCEYCGKIVIRRKRADSKYRFCSSSCAAKVVISIANKRNRFGSRNSFWKGGKWKNSYGYVLIYSPNHPHPNHQKGKYVFEHRLVIENYLKRYLKIGERIHHINGIKDDNRLENLKLFSSQGEHFKIHKSEETINSSYWLGKKMSTSTRLKMSKSGKLVWKTRKSAASLQQLDR